MSPFSLLLLLAVTSTAVLRVSSLTDPGDYAVLDEFRKGLSSSDLLGWPINDPDPCGNNWPHVFCSGSRVTQIQVKNLSLKGPLPQSFNKLTMLQNIGMQGNSFNGPLPTFSGLSSLRFAYLGGNQFDSIPLDFFDGLTSLAAISLDGSPLNATTGWTLPGSIANCAQLVNFSCTQCNVVGEVPAYFGGLTSLAWLRLSYNALTGVIPAELAGSNLQGLVLNNQAGSGMSGSIHVLASMPSLVTVWLHGNSFSGSIPENITTCVSLTDLNLNGNKLTGLVPMGLENLTRLENVDLNNNLFLGPIPDLKIKSYSYSNNPFCQAEPGVPCSPAVMALLEFLAGVNYPSDLSASWFGNDPCNGWLGVSCQSGSVAVINLPKRSLSGFISPSLGRIDSLVTINLNGNNLSGVIPASLAGLSSLRMLNLESNNLSPPVPAFGKSVTLLVDKNLYIQNPDLQPPPTPPTTPGGSPVVPGGSPVAPGGSPGNSPSPPGSAKPSPSNSSSPGSNKVSGAGSSAGKTTTIVIALASAAAAIMVMLLIALRVRHRRKEKNGFGIVEPGSIVVHPRDSSNLDNIIKISVADSASKNMATLELQSMGDADTHFFDSGNLLVSLQVLRKVTRNFHPENEVGRGGFGVVYKGELHDGTMIAVKRMEAMAVSNQASDEFRSEIQVLSKVRHRNLVSLLGFSIEGSERLLVYEYMTQGALSKHLFHWKKLGLEPLSWKKRLNIALDVARGMEYLHSLAKQSFIHRDLKSSNILLDDGYRAKIADFGLVKLAPDGKNSVATRLAGTFGYLAPEYAVTGKITTKADVFSFGVVLMELITGMPALDENRPEETRYLASWFFVVKSNEAKLRAAIDKSIEQTEETMESIRTIAELAGHCAAREPHQRPDMGHAVNILAPLVEKWKPLKDDHEEFLGIDLHQPLLQMVKGWQADDVSIQSDMSSMCFDDSKGSIPARPTGFAESFTSADGR